MKKIIVCEFGEWTKKLITLSRFEEIDYFVDRRLENEETSIESCGIEKKVYPVSRLADESPDDTILIIGDSKRYFEYKEKLEEFGFKENIHFFNGWKLTANFYTRLFGENSWKKIEDNHNSIFSEEKVYGYRAKAIAELIPKEVKSIMDLGCGNGALKNYLKGIRYLGVDYKKRSEETIVCDLEKDPLPDIAVDMYCMLGVLYYLKNVPDLICQMQKANYILITYRGMEHYLRLDGRFDGIYSGGIENPMYTADLINLLSGYGFILAKWVRGYPMGEIICNEDIFIFKKIVWKDNRGDKK